MTVTKDQIKKNPFNATNPILSSNSNPFQLHVKLITEVIMPERTKVKRKPCISCNMVIHVLLFFNPQANERIRIPSKETIEQILAASLTQFTIINAFQWYTYLREISQYFRHLVSSFTTSYVDNDVRVGKLGEGLGDNSFSTTKGSWDSCCSSLNTPVRQQPLFP